MKNTKKIRVLAVITAIIMLAMPLSVFAEDKDISGADLSFAERAEYALQGTVTGLLMVFAVLALLWGILSLSKVIFYDIPRKKQSDGKEEKDRSEAVEATVNTPLAADLSDEIGTEDDGELAAVITAAVAAMIESGEYGDQFVGGFRVVSFKRASVGAWNKK